MPSNHTSRGVACPGFALDISVNVSGRQLDDDRVIEHIRQALDASGLEATALIIEVTETALMRDADSVAQRLQSIKDLGVRIAVDDFGTGYSSLAYLQQFPVSNSARIRASRPSPRASRQPVSWTFCAPITSTKLRDFFLPAHSKRGSLKPSF